MTKRKIPSKFFWIALLIPVLVLTSMLIKPVTTMIKGKEIILATIPIDPRDLFYGDYVTLNLEIEQLDIALLDPSLQKQLEQKDNFRKGISVFVSLREGENGIYQAVAVSKEKPDGLFIQGKMFPYIFENHWNEEAELKKYVQIEYGVDRFYVEEGTGMELEKQANEGKVLVNIKIHDGYPILTGIKGVQ